MHGGDGRGSNIMMILFVIFQNNDIYVICLFSLFLHFVSSFLVVWFYVLWHKYMCCFLNSSHTAKKHGRIWLFFLWHKQKLNNLFFLQVQQCYSFNSCVFENWIIFQYNRRHLNKNVFSQFMLQSWILYWSTFIEHICHTIQCFYRFKHH